MSQLSKEFVKNNDSSNNLGSVNTTHVEALQQRAAKVLPSLCLLSRFDTGQNAWQMVSPNFVIKVIVFGFCKKKFTFVTLNCFTAKKFLIFLNNS